MRWLLVLFVALLSQPAMAQSAVLERAVVEVIRPATAAFAAEARELGQAMTLLCAVRSAEHRAAAEAAFAETALAFGRIELVRVGPITDENRLERLLFWPDRRGIGLRQVQAILVEADANATTSEGLAQKSVAVQGLGALEFVLFGTGAETLARAEGTFRCQYGRAIAGNVATMAGEIEAGWTADDGIAGRLIAPDAGNSDYRTDTEALEALVGMLSHGVEAVRDTRINPFIAADGEEANPCQALFWRSGLTMPMIAANMDGLAALYRVSGVGATTPEMAQGIGNSIDFEFRNAERALALIVDPVDAAVADPKQAQALSYLVIVTQSLQAMIGEQLSAALGLSVGFSSLDGD